MALLVRFLVVVALVLSAPSLLAQETDPARTDEFRKGKDYFLAIKRYEEAFAESGTYVTGKKLATTYWDFHEYAKAEAVYRKLEPLEGFIAPDHFEFAQLLLHNGKAAESLEHFKTYLRLNPEDDNAQTVFQYASLLANKSLDTACTKTNASALCIRIDATDSRDPGNPHLIYEWVIEDEPPVTGFVIEHCFEQAGTYYARLNVIDITTGLKYNNDTIVPIEINDAGQFDVDGQKLAGKELGFNASYRLIFSDKDYTFVWDLGDGHYGSGQYYKHTYSNSGNYQVKMYLLSYNEKGVLQPGCAYDKVTVTTNIHDIY